MHIIILLVVAFGGIGGGHALWEKNHVRSGIALFCIGGYAAILLSYQ